VRSGVLVSIAGGTRQAEIVHRRRPLARARRDVIHLAADATDLFRGQAVLAATSSPLAHETTQDAGEVSARHGPELPPQGLWKHDAPAARGSPGLWRGARPNADKLQSGFAAQTPRRGSTPALQPQN